MSDATAVFVAEVGDINRFNAASQLACWAGLTPKHHESDQTVHRGRITKQGRAHARGMLVEAAWVRPRSPGRCAPSTSVCVPAPSVPRLSV